MRGSRGGQRSARGCWRLRLRLLRLGGGEEGERHIGLVGTTPGLAGRSGWPLISLCALRIQGKHAHALMEDRLYVCGDGLVCGAVVSARLAGQRSLAPVSTDKVTRLLGGLGANTTMPGVPGLSSVFFGVGVCVYHGSL